MSTSIILLITSIGLIVLPISAAMASDLSLGDKSSRKLVENKHNEYKKQNQRIQQTIKPFDKFIENLHKIV